MSVILYNCSVVKCEKLKNEFINIECSKDLIGEAVMIRQGRVDTPGLSFH